MNIFEALNNLSINNLITDDSVKNLLVSFEIKYINPDSNEEESYKTDAINIDLNNFPNKYKRNLLSLFVDYTSSKSLDYEKLNIVEIGASLA